MSDLTGLPNSSHHEGKAFSHPNSLFFAKGKLALRKGFYSISWQNNLPTFPHRLTPLANLLIKETGESRGPSGLQTDRPAPLVALCLLFSRSREVLCSHPSPSLLLQTLLVTLPRSSLPPLSPSLLYQKSFFFYQIVSINKQAYSLVSQEKENGSSWAHIFFWPLHVQPPLFPGTLCLPSRHPLCPKLTLTRLELLS